MIDKPKMCCYPDCFNCTLEDCNFDIEIEKRRERQKRYYQTDKGKENEKQKRQRKIQSGKNAEYCRRYYYKKKMQMQSA